MCDPILVTLLKMQPHYSQSSRENATPSSGTSPVASYKEVPPPPGLPSPSFEYFVGFYSTGEATLPKNYTRHLLADVFLDDFHRIVSCSKRLNKTRLKKYACTVLEFVLVRDTITFGLFQSPCLLSQASQTHDSRNRSNFILCTRIE